MARLPYLQRGTLGEAALPLLSTLGDAALSLAALPSRLGRAGWPSVPILAVVIFVSLNKAP